MFEPLRKCYEDGTLYSRGARLEANLAELYSLCDEDLFERCKITDRSQVGYVPSECLLTLVRDSRQNNSDARFERLYSNLIARVMSALPRIKGGTVGPQSLFNANVRDRALDRFLELLVSDRNAYIETLDFYEIRFDLGIKRLRQAALRSEYKHLEGRVPLEYDNETGELSAEVENAAGTLEPFEELEKNDPIFRSHFNAAINALPEEQRRTIQMLRLGFTRHSDDPQVETIAKVLGVTAKSVWNYERRAIKSLRDVLQCGDEI